MRGNWSRKCLETQAKRVLDRADSLDPIQAGQEFGVWVDSLLLIADVGTLPLGLMLSS